MHKLVEQLTSAYAVSGDERRLHDILRSALDGIADEIHDTPLGNLIAIRKGRSSEHSILFAAHLDEVGAWVTRINDKGFLGIHCRSIDGRVWPGLQVVVHGTEPLPGIIGLKPVHVMSHDEMNKPVGPDELWIDIGLPREQVLTMVPIGSTVTFTAGISHLMNERFAGKTQDDRLCGVALVEALELLKDVTLPWPSLSRRRSPGMAPGPAATSRTPTSVSPSTSRMPTPTVFLSTRPSLSAAVRASLSALSPMTMSSN